jgi:hypothetical protein
MHLIRSSKRKSTKCPVAGCAADVTAGSLEEDREVAYRVEREAKRANKRKRKARTEEYTQV